MVDAKQKCARFHQFISEDDKMLDYGSGLGTVTKLLLDEGYSVVPLDVENHSFFESTMPKLYDGKKTNFKDKSFDVVLILTVLHHLSGQKEIINEAFRIGKKVIIIEDIYTNLFQKHLTHWIDSLVNLEFKGHPHSNKTAEGWENLFENLGCKLVFKNEKRYMLFFRQVVYVLKKE